MNKAQRAPWLAVCRAPTEPRSLCNFCRYAEWGESWGCKEGRDCTCTHSLAYRMNDWQMENIPLGGDCWAFRPGLSWEDACTVAGYFIRHPERRTWVLYTLEEMVDRVFYLQTEWGWLNTRWE